MIRKLYTGKGGEAPAAPKQLPLRGADRANHPISYLADEGLVDAANTALLLRQPLLLTGEPGTGKTQFAASLSWELGLGPQVLRYDAKSYSKSKELFYIVDTLSWFQVAQSGTEKKATALDFINYNALGEAVLFANDYKDIKEFVPAHLKHPGKRKRSVVLIDEIDKAPRDFSNDLLSELDEMRFRIPELKNVEIAADTEFAPILVLTSNSEKDLPDAFLRRCIYYDIPFPERDRLRAIVQMRLSEAVADDTFLNDALDLLEELRSPTAGLRKRPATAELLGWISALRRMAPDSPNPLKEDPGLAKIALAALVKTRDDLDRARPVIEAWVRKREQRGGK